MADVGNNLYINIYSNTAGDKFPGNDMSLFDKAAYVVMIELLTSNNPLFSYRRMTCHYEIMRHIF